MISDSDNVLYQNSAAPENAGFYYERPRINALLADAIKKPLTSVVAGAGYGKTQAVSSLLRDPCLDPVWLQLSVLDNHVYRFWERFAYGFGRHNPRLAQSLKAMGFPETNAAFDKFLRLFAAGLDRKKTTVLILDDFHLIYQNAAISFLENLILARVRNFSVVLISRKKPESDSSALFAKGLLSRITEDDLRFTKEEVSEYYEALGLDLDESTSESIFRRTEGWIFAVCLIGLAVKKGGNTADPLALAKDDIYALIEKEIFSGAADGLKKLLVRISLPDHLPEGLLNLIAGASGFSGSSLISETPSLGQFIRRETFSDAYRIHHLLKCFLWEHRYLLTASEIADTHYTAARWYEENGLLPDAAEHYEKCGRYNEIFGMILAFPRQCPQETADRLIKLIDRAPREFTRARPVMPVVKSYYLLNNNRIDEAYALLSGLRRQYEALTPPSEETRAVLGEIYIVLALISKIEQSYDFEELFKKADALLPGGSALVGQDFNIAEGINITGIKSSAAGELKRYCEAMSRAMPYAARVMNGCNYGAEYLNAADACFMTGDIPGAEKNAFEAVFRAGSKKQFGIVCMAEFILIRIYALKGDYAKAAALLKQMKQRQDSGEAGSIPLYDIIEGWFYVKLGETGKVRKWIRRAGGDGSLLPPVIIGREYLVRSDSLLAEGEYGELLALTAYTDTVYRERGILYAIIQNKITKAIIHHYTGDRAASVEELNGAWRLSNPNNLIIQYIEYGNRMRTLISAVKKNPSCVIPESWLDNIYKKSSSYAKQIANAVNDYRKKHVKKSAGPYAGLSPRETEVLNYLCRGMTRKEIADACYLSANTVKSILQSVYSKLGAANNADAVFIASRLGLIKQDV